MDVMGGLVVLRGPVAAPARREPKRICYPDATGACWRRHTVLSGQKRCSGIRFPRSAHCISGFAASVQFLVVGDEAVVPASSERHRGRYGAS